MTLKTGITDWFDERLGAEFGRTLTQNVRPKLLSAVAGTQSIVLTFDKAMDPATVGLASLIDAAGTRIEFGAARPTDWVTRKVFEVPLRSVPFGGFDLQVASTTADLWANPVESAGMIHVRDYAGPKVTAVGVLNGAVKPPYGG